ncbi:HAD family hydrolase [Embleya sp. NPDC005575]|uniref:HAD family hydrolase n=1 Tax=Embleya sp. NPDC005575 TaxID=3156892 RepID=UPI0033A47ECE
MRLLVLFDLDNTLIDRSATFARWSAEFAVERRLGDGAVRWLASVDGDGFVPRERFFAGVRSRFRLPESVEALCSTYRARMAELARCRDEVLTALADLRASGRRIGVVTNGHPSQQVATMRNTGLAAHVDGWAVSEQEGVRKPDPRLFEIAAARCGGLSLADGGWCVGDDPVADIGGGRAAGLTTIWVQRIAEWPTGRMDPPDHRVTDVTGAFEILASGGAQTQLPCAAGGLSGSRGGG